jgi:hypothetical protein
VTWNPEMIETILKHREHHKKLHNIISFADSKISLNIQLSEPSNHKFERPERICTLFRIIFINVFDEWHVISNKSPEI